MFRGRKRDRGANAVLELKEELLREGLKNFVGRISNKVDVDNMCERRGPLRETVFHLMITDENIPDSYKEAISGQAHILGKTNIYGNTVGHIVAEYGSEAAVKKMLELLESTNNREVNELRGQVNDRHRTILDVVKRRGDIKYTLRTDKDKQT